MSELEELLGFALEALDEVEAIVGRGYSEFAASIDRQRALAFCWIAVGSAIKDYAHIAKLQARQEPLSSPIRFRNRIAHQSLSRATVESLPAAAAAISVVNQHHAQAPLAADPLKNVSAAQTVDLTCQHTNHTVLVEGPEISVRPVGTRCLVASGS